MKRTISTLVVASFATILSVNGASAQSMTNATPAMSKEKSLYQRLGGYDAIAAVSDDFIGRLATEPAFVRFFPGLSSDSKMKLRQHVVDLLCFATGGPCIYTGRDMKTSHKGLGITGAEWDIAIKHLVETLDKFSVPTKERQDLFVILGPLKEQIVEKN